MARDTLTGSRIRERRVMAGMKQAELARRADISASYLNLIEHNRRRIGGKLLLDIADVLGVEPSLLTDGAEATLIAQLRESASSMPQVDAELGRVDEFAGRFPGWAHLLAETHRRVGALERTVVGLTDRMTHDPHLADSLHSMLTTVTAIHSSASILAESGDLEPEWRDRFSRNVHEDSARLAEVSQSLVQYLDASADAPQDVQSPQEELDKVLKQAGPRFGAIEAGADPDEVAKSLSQGLSAPAQELLAWALKRYARDAEALPGPHLVAAARTVGSDPFALAADLGKPPDLVMRRLAALGAQCGLPDLAFAICDGAGMLVHRQPSARLALPRFGTGCGQLPLYQALTQPYVPLVTWIEPLANDTSPLLAYAYATPSEPVRPGQRPVMRAHMLVVEPGADTKPDPRTTVPVGVACRICSRTGCAMRHEPSILSGGL